MSTTIKTICVCGAGTMGSGIANAIIEMLPSIFSFFRDEKLSL